MRGAQQAQQAEPLTARRAREVVAEVADPEIPVLTIADLGVLREVTVDAGGRVHVTITPTYSGCPAMDAIRDDIVEALRERGAPDVSVHTTLSPPWTTDWVTEQGRRKLREYGVAPPEPTGRPGPVPVVLAARCPRCGSADTREISRFGSTACKAIHACNSCLEPFDRFKTL
ncbi:MAG: 1,2-phenylacetyl-CoA epoxidase subunit PaaD [Carbonactinosporaceae bacterium]